MYVYGNVHFTIFAFRDKGKKTQQRISRNTYSMYVEAKDRKRDSDLSLLSR